MLLSIEQEEAADLCADLTQRIVYVSGEAGTGKTTIFGPAIDALQDNLLVQICAPTGRASKRVEEATGIKAKTIHRMLGYGMPEPDEEESSYIRYNKNNRMPFDVIFVDESSMISKDLYRNVIDAMKHGSCIRFFGDTNQLPPVKGTSPFADIIKRYPGVTLTENFRSTDGIISSAREINRGYIPTNNNKFTIINMRSNEIITALTNVMDKNFATLECQLITSTRRGKYGTIALNNYLQSLLNDNKESYFPIKYPDNDKDFKLYRGDKIIWTKNDYRLNLLNGMIGFVVDYDLDTGEIILEMDGKDKLIPPYIESYDKNGKAIFSYDPRKNIELAYAVTTHKSQGSEFAKVVYVMVRNYVLSRQNFYTAVTRAKDHVTVYCGTGAIGTAMRKQRINE